MRKHNLELVKLNNGAEGLLIHVPGATVMNFELNFRAGEFLIEDRSKWEVAHLMEHVILGANKKYPEARQFNAEFSKNGAYTNAYTGYYSIGYIGETADFEWERVLKLQLLALREPLFLQKEFKAEWGNIHDELISYTNNHFRHLGTALTQSFGFDHPTDKERAELMVNVKRADLIDHYHRTHSSDNMRFIIAGNTRGRKAKIIELLEQSNLQRGEYFDLPKEQASRPKSPVFIANETVPNIYLIVNTFANHILPQDQDDALQLARIMLTDTLHSRIFGAAREKGLVYSVGSNHHRSSEMTEWWLSSQVLPDNAPALCEIIVSEINRVQKGRINEEDIKAAKQYALGSFQRSMQTVGNITSSYNRFFFDGHIEDINTIPKRIRAVNKQLMASAFTAIFAEKVGTIGVLGGTDPKISNKLYTQLKNLWN